MIAKASSNVNFLEALQEQALFFLFSKNDSYGSSHVEAEPLHHPTLFFCYERTSLKTGSIQRGTSIDYVHPDSNHITASIAKVWFSFHLFNRYFLS